MDSPREGLGRTLAVTLSVEVVPSPETARKMEQMTWKWRTEHTGVRLSSGRVGKVQKGHLEVRLKISI